MFYSFIPCGRKSTSDFVLFKTNTHVTERGQNLVCILKLMRWKEVNELLWPSIKLENTHLSICVD